MKDTLLTYENPATCYGGPLMNQAGRERVRAVRAGAWAPWMSSRSSLAASGSTTSSSRTV
jgi:hypothetical protein